MQIIKPGRNKKGSFLASFFIIIFFFAHIANCLAASDISNSLDIDPALSGEIYTAKLEALAQHPTWYSLIHFDGKHSRIEDPGFLLARDNFSPERELKLTLQFFTQSSDAPCRFPARYIWLKSQLSLPEQHLNHCTELQEFERRAPAGDIALVFASENLSQPSSMMGHVLIKMSGINHTGTQVSHAISFYTDVRGINVPKLFYDSMVVGKKGYFALTPYQEKVDRYHGDEGRNVWEYQLKLSDTQKRLIQYHMYELKLTDLIYYFDDYNCATLTRFIIGLAGAYPDNKDFFWVTPIDVVKLTHERKMIAAVKLIPADRWKIRMLSSELVKANRLVIESSLTAPGELRKINSTQQRFIAYEIAEAYARTQAEQSRIQTSTLVEFLSQAENDRAHDPQFDIDISRYKSPLNTPSDSQIGLGFYQSQDENFIKLDLLPTSHKLEDDNSQYFAETELTLSELSLMYSLDDNMSKLHHFTLYGVQSLMPRDSFTGGLSGSFKLGSDMQFHDDTKQHSQAYVEGSLGQTYEISRGILGYGLFRAGLAHSRFDTYIYSQPELGIIINKMPNLKSRIFAAYLVTSSPQIPDQYQWVFEQSIFFAKSWAGVVNLERTHMGIFKDTAVSVSLKHYF
jgi:hypothetical protein